MVSFLYFLLYISTNGKYFYFLFCIRTFFGLFIGFYFHLIRLIGCTKLYVIMISKNHLMFFDIVCSSYFFI